MHEFMLNIDNKEILNEVLHHSIDHLIGSTEDKDEQILLKSCHKYGFSSVEQFEKTVEIIANAFKLYVLNVVSEVEFLSQFSHLSLDLQQSILAVLKTRKSEVVVFLLREHNSKHYKLLQSFDWDIRFVFGDSNNPSLRREIASLTLNCIYSNENEKKPKESSIFMELDRKMLDTLIEVLENCEALLKTN
ncbi:COMM domain-containing protein 8-like [Condylostylus longicornis]|uniref:COMM domain-containing protein 8-like n=1 Tax=Condylostylus longicornis TaxID=2530218 RepID=UPI00244E0A5D|nr:COMM domain-containing protein 8-like [Condylostylus longicornis]